MKLVKGLSALIVLLGLIVGLPFALFAAAGNPLERLPEILQLASRPDYGLIITMSTILPLLGWGLWLYFLLSVFLEIPSALKGIHAPRIKGFGSAQGIAGALLAAVIGIFGVVGPANAATIDTSMTTPTTISASQQAGQGNIDHQAATAAAQKTDTPETFKHTVKSGDTLWGLAEQHLGDGAKYKKILDCNPHITDADEIYAGTTLNIPKVKSSAPRTTPKSSHTAPPKEAVHDTSQDSTTKTTNNQEQQVDKDVADALSTPTPTQTPETSTQAQPDAVETQEAQGPAGQQAEDSFMGNHLLQTVTGIGGLLAAGLLTMIGRRRLHQRRIRTAGQRTTPVSDTAARTERELREVEDTVTQETIDTALRFLGSWATENGMSLPKIFCLRAATGNLTFYLSEATELPEPWVKDDIDGIVWSLNPEDVPTADEGTEAPYPAMVTLGEDTKNAQILVDAEYIGALGVEDHHNGTSHQILTALAVELACSPWSEQLTLSFCGVADELPEALGTGRISSYESIKELLTMLEGKAADVKTAMEAQGAQTMHEARATTGQSWMPEIVLLGIEPTDRQRHQLLNLVGQIPRLGIAAITAGFTMGDWKLGVDNEGYALLDPVGLTLKPQKIDHEQQQAIMELLAKSSLQPQVPNDGMSPDEDAAEEAVIELHAVPSATAIDAQGAPEALTDPTDQRAISDEKPDEHVTDTRGETTEEAVEEAEKYDESTELTEPANARESETAPAETSGVETADNSSETVGSTERADNGELTDGTGLADGTEQVDDSALADVKAPVDSGAGESGEPKPALEIVKDEAPAPVSADGMSPEVLNDLDDPDAVLDEQAQQLLTVLADGKAPILRLLGTVDLLNARGKMPTSPATGKESPGTEARCTSLLAYLAMNPGATTEQYNEAFWPGTQPSGAKGAQNRNKLANLTRDYLGQDADGTMLFPHARNERYSLDTRVLCDWDIFTKLIGNNVYTVSLPRLIAALKLVRGAPFDGIRPKNYLWNTALHTEMIELITEAAHELVDRAMASNNPKLARLGAQVGRTVDPANEQAWRDALNAEYIAKNRNAVQDIANKLQDYLGAYGDDDEPADETQELINQLREVGYVA